MQNKAIVSLHIFLFHGKIVLRMFATMLKHPNFEKNVVTLFSKNKFVLYYFPFALKHFCIKNATVSQTFSEMSLFKEESKSCLKERLKMVENTLQSFIKYREKFEIKH